MENEKSKKIVFYILALLVLAGIISIIYFKYREAEERVEDRFNVPLTPSPTPSPKSMTVPCDPNCDGK